MKDRCIQVIEKEESSVLFTPESARRDILLREGDPDCPLYLFKRWKSIRSRRTGGALHTRRFGPLLNLEKEKGGPPPHALKEEEISPQVIRGKRRELLSRREVHYLLASRFLVLRRVKRPHS